MSDEELNQQSANSSPEDSKEVKDENWARILGPRLEGDSPRRVLLWGRFWGLEDQVAVAFYLLVEPDEKKVITLRLAVYGSHVNLHEYNPRLEYSDFERRILEYSVSRSPVPTVTLNQIRDQIREFILDGENIETIASVLEDENEEAYYEWFKELVADVISKGDSVFQVRGQIASAGKIKRVSKSEADKEKLKNGKVLKVRFVSNPREGVPSSRLREGMPVYARVVGEAVEKLPEDMRDSEHKEVSVPVQGWVFKIESNPTLPDDFEGDPADYKEVTVELNPGIYGKGYVFKEDKIKIDRDVTTPDVMPEDIIRIIFLLVLLIIVFLILIYAG